MSRFDERLEQNLRQIADRATPSPNAWTAIQTRIADQDPAEETEIIMLTETDPPARRRWPVLAAAAVAVMALVVGLGLIARDDESEQSDPPAPSPTEVLELFVQAFNAHDIDAVVALYADDAVVTGHPLIENGKITEWEMITNSRPCPSPERSQPLRVGVDGSRSERAG